MSGKNNLVDQVNGGEGPIWIWSLDLVVSELYHTLSCPRRNFALWKIGREVKNYVKLPFEAKVMADWRPTQYFSPAPFQQTAINQTFAFLLIELHFWFAGNEKPWYWVVMVLSRQRCSWYHTVLFQSQRCLQKCSHARRRVGGWNSVEVTALEAFPSPSSIGQNKFDG